MDEITQRVRSIGARRKRLRDELTSADAELRKLMPSAKAMLTQEEIRAFTGLSIQTIRTYTARG
ncbi:hypothetical protein QQM39_26160 [Streptomyces sp. DT2A-34]|uniref:hypothetical protein n=1 Tax=Streptomyces sp. DT2A-34 TaxID=3051182 RepID=UPI00265BDE32|nr:hypothetical protein [Streptomyces sp. DT2A-34]MDO0914186.1 hypothetical protein [Streptomyces sp. DT2A-34]